MANINLDDATLRAAQATDRFPVKSANGETIEAVTAQAIADLANKTFTLSFDFGASDIPNINITEEVKTQLQTWYTNGDIIDIVLRNSANTEEQPITNKIIINDDEGNGYIVFRKDYGGSTLRQVSLVIYINWTTNIVNIAVFEISDISSGSASSISEAPLDGNQYGRQNGGWTAITSSGGGSNSYAPVFYNYPHPRMGWNDDGCFRLLILGNSNIQSALDIYPFLEDLGIERSQYSVYFAMIGGSNLSNFTDILENNGTTPIWIIPTSGLSTTTGDLEHNSSYTIPHIFSQSWDLVILSLSANDAIGYNNEIQNQMVTLIGSIKENCANQNVPIGLAQILINGQNSQEGWVQSVTAINRQLNEVGIDFIIPLGTTFQNARNTTGLQTEDDLLGDGIHAVSGIGHYLQIGTLIQTVFSPVFNIKFSDNNANLTGTIPTTEANKALANRCIINAIANRTIVRNAADNPITPTERFSVTYNGNGSTSGTITDSNNYISGSTVTVSNNHYLRTGYAFASFNTAADGSGTTYAPTDTFTITANVTLYAIWTEIPQGQFIVSYNANQGTGSMIDSNTYVANATVTVLNNTFTREGYIFASFNTELDGSGTNYLSGSTFTITDNITLYAIWTQEQPLNRQRISFSGSAVMDYSNFRNVAQLFNDAGEELTMFTPEGTNWVWRTGIAIDHVNLFNIGIPVTYIELSEIPSGVTNLGGLGQNIQTLTRLEIRTFTRLDGTPVPRLGYIAYDCINLNFITMPLLGDIEGVAGSFGNNTGFTSVAEGIVNDDGTISSPAEGVFPSQLYNSNMGFVNI